MVALAGLELTEILLSPPPGCWDERCAPYHQACVHPTTQPLRVAVLKLLSHLPTPFYFYF